MNAVDGAQGNARPRPRRTALLYALAGTAAAAGGATWWTLGQRDPAPDVRYTLLDGREIELKSLRGKVVLVNFWATSCSVCVEEMPAIVDTDVKFKARGYETLAIAMSYDPRAYVERFVATRKLPFAVGLDGKGTLARAFGDVRLTPTTFLIDKQGRIVKRYLGKPDFKALHALIERLLAESGAT